MMRIHRNLAQASVEIIDSVFNEQRVLDRSLAKAFEANRKWGKRDRSFIAETCFEVVRWRRALAFLADNDSTEALCATQWVRMGFTIPDWWPHPGIDPEELNARESKLAEQPRAIRESIPDWLDALGATQLGKNWEANLHALNQRGRVYLRVNRLKTTREEAIAWLAEQNIFAELVEGSPDALVLPAGKTISKPLLNEGLFEIQDAGSQLIAPLLNAESVECVIDTCAGAGGKTLHLAAEMGDRGKLIAMDVAPRKLKELERRAKRAGISCIETQLINAKALKALESTADRILIDAPCSGLGTLKRQPDLKWRLNPEQITDIRKTQAELLESYTRMLKPGGRLVYATCSVLPSENREQIDQLLRTQQFTLESEHVITPAALGFDGFYAAALTKH